MNGNGCAASELDTDGDGVSDADDQCPGSNGAVDANGCAADQRDSDGDGVNDNLDAFPNDPSETADSDGDGVGDNADVFPNNANESSDADGDGVGDNSDQCSNTPAGQSVNANGCALSQLDTDGDGVNDAADLCPGSSGSVDTNGCAANQRDSDGDGVNDALDAFPFDATESSDSDGDGVGDNADQCANTPSNEAANAEGCSDSQIVLDGAAVYTELTCANCHGADGAGIGNFPDIRGLDAGAIRAAVAAGGTMGAVGSGWSDKQIDAVGDYISQWEAPLDGATLYADLSCSGCHGADGAGIGNFPDIRGLDANAIRAAVSAGGTMGAVGGGWSSEEIDAVGGYISQWEAPLDGATVYADLGCAGCHGANGAGVGNFPDIRGLDANAIRAAIAAGGTMGALGSGWGDADIDAVGDYIFEMVDAAALYSASCAGCHGATGAGSGPFPAVQGLTAGDITAAIQTGNTMPAVAGSLTKGQINALGAYIFEF